jgi:predicted transcriptional regulator
VDSRGNRPDPLYDRGPRVGGPKLHFVECTQTQATEVAMKVKDAMHKGVDWVSPDTPVTELAKLMRDHDVGAIPIGRFESTTGSVMQVPGTAILRQMIASTVMNMQIPPVSGSALG